MQKVIDNLECFQGVHFEFINSFKNNGTKYLLILLTHMQKFPPLRSLWILLLPVDFAKLVLYSINTTYSTKVN